MRCRTWIAVMAMACCPMPPAWAQAASPPPVLRLLSQGSEIVFVTRQMGVPVEGRFMRFDARIALDPRQPQAGSVMISIDTASARFGSAEIDAELPKATWLNVVAFPSARFESAAIKAAGPGRFEVIGKLGIKGHLHELTVPVQIAQNGGISTASGQFTIKRLDYRVGEAEWADTSLLADEVQVRFKFVLGGLGGQP